MNSVQNLCRLMIIVDYATQYIGDNPDPIEGSLQTNQLIWVCLNMYPLDSNRKGGKMIHQGQMKFRIR